MVHVEGGVNESLVDCWSFGDMCQSLRLRFEYFLFAVIIVFV